MTALVLLVLALPAILAVLLLVPGTHRRVRAIWPLAPLPALALALATPVGWQVEVPWLLLGAIFGLDAKQQVMLLFIAPLWAVAAFYARGYHARDPRRRRFFAFFLITMTGNLGLLLSRDIVSFYFFFVVMNFAAYGLVVHSETAEARRAGLVYIVLVVTGEALILPAIWYTAAQSGSLALAGAPAAVAAMPQSDLVIACLLLGFGIKAGALPLHVWLPLAHPVAPTPASAVLSGAMIKAGLLAWLHFLPLGEAALPVWSNLVITMGLLAAFYGVAIGIAQDQPKTLLAYSSISQMGLITIAVGVGIGSQTAWPAAQAGALAYAFHHGLAKGALFLGVGVVENAASERARRLALWLLLLPALALAGAPFTSGALAKVALKDAVAAGPLAWAPWLDLLLPVAAVGTTLLMARFHLLMRRAEAHAAGARARLLWGSWLVLLAAVALLTWLPPVGSIELIAHTFEPYALWAALWPVLLGGVVVAVAVIAGERLGPIARLRIPAGDLLVPALALGRAGYALGLRLAALRPRGAALRLRPSRAQLARASDLLARAEGSLMRFPAVAVVLLLVVLALLLERLLRAGGAPS